MTFILEQNSYGKARVRMLKVTRGGDRHSVTDLTAQITLRGDFESAYAEADNSRVVPTDTMKNTVYALGKSHPLDCVESFATHLGAHFIESFEQVDEATVELSEAPWSRIERDGVAHSHAFVHGGTERGTCRVSASESSVRVSAGITGLALLKTTGSAFRGFPRDTFTTLPEADDRLLGTLVTATWDYSSAAADYPECRRVVRAALVHTFADHRSESVQHTLHAMAVQALEDCPDLARIHLSLPNRHCLLVDLEPFGLENDGEIFLPIDEPYGLIEATVARG